MFISRVIISICIIFGSLGAISKEQCSQSLVSLLESNKQSQMHDLFKQCASHGTPEQQLQEAKKVAQVLKKPDVESSIDKTLQEIKKSEQSQGLSWWQWLAGGWALLGCCVAAQKAIEDHYEQESIDEENEENEKNVRKKRKVKQAI